MNNESEAERAGAQDIESARIDISKISEKQNYRETFDPDELALLAQDIAKRGLLQPIGIEPEPESADRYTIIFGHRRYRAHLLAGYKLSKREFLITCAPKIAICPR